MHARWLRLPLLCCALWLSLGTAHAQQTLYAATTGEDNGGGKLYIIDPTTAAATLVGPILVGGFQVGVTGLAFNPLTGVLYGVTDHASKYFLDSLITINPADASATLIGPLGQILTDISFDSTGMLYGWLEPPPYNLVSINLTTGTATIIGPPAVKPFDSDGALAFNAGGTLYLVSNEGSMACCSLSPYTYVLRTVDKITGTTSSPEVVTLGGTDLVVNSMDFNSTGTLFASAVDSDGFSSLYTIDITTGIGTFVGSLPDAVTNALAFTPVAPAFLIRYFSNLNIGDSFIDITNSGASATANLMNQIPAQNNIDGSVCVNIYAFAADEQEVACCSCLVTPNGLWSASVKTALLNSVLTPSFPNEVVVKLIPTVPAVGAGGTQTCNPAAVNQGNVSKGLLAWGTSLHGLPTATGPNFRLAETPFLAASLSSAELVRDVEECQFIQVLGSGQFGICKGCSNVGLGAAHQ
jgi:hypothetical protein